MERSSFFQLHDRKQDSVCADRTGSRSDSVSSASPSSYRRYSAAFHSISQRPAIL